MKKEPTNYSTFGNRERETDREEHIDRHTDREYRERKSFTRFT